MHDQFKSYNSTGAERLDGPDTKLTPAGQIRAEPLRNGSWLISIGRAKYAKRFQLSRAEAAELVRVLSRDVLTAAELQQ